MKIAIPVANKSMKSDVYESFGRTPYFLVYNTDTKENIYIENSASVSQGGAGIRAAQIIVDSNVNVLITYQCGEKAADVLNAANITIYKPLYKSTSENIHAFLGGKLLLLDEIDAGFHPNGGE